MKITLTQPKPRNRPAVAARLRHAGSHRPLKASRRQQADRALRRDLDDHALRRELERMKHSP